jgi:hypothetical protein
VPLDDFNGGRVIIGLNPHIANLVSIHAVVLSYRLAGVSSEVRCFAPVSTGTGWQNPEKIRSKGANRAKSAICDTKGRKFGEKRP